MIKIEIMNAKKIVISFLISILVFMNVVIVANESESTELKKKDAKADSTVSTELTFDQKIGMNGFVDCKFDNLKAAGILREYHNFGWTYDANSGKCYFQSSWFDFDEFYKKLHENGIEVLPCIQQGNNKENREYKPVEDGADTTDAQSYKIHSNVMFNYAARYGSKEVEKSRLNLTDKTEAKSGLGYIKYYENWNEPDKTWIGEKAHFSPEEFAAMCSADYDGHEGKLGNTYGIKQADPEAKLVYGGLAGGEAGVQYLEGMKKWAEENRSDKKLPFDVINFHAYCGTHSPENSSFRQSAESLINWKNENAPYLEVWITEFGWDTNTESPRSAPSYDTQRDWIIREYLMADRLGLSRATVYNGRDDGSPESTTQYATCGLTTGKGKEERKSSWYGVNTAKNTLKGFYFDSVVEESENVYIYKYKNNDNEECYVVWSPTEDGSNLLDYEIKLEDATNAELIELKDKEELGIKSELQIEENMVKVNVTESPKFIKVKTNKSEESSEEESKEESKEDSKEEKDTDKKEEDKSEDKKDNKDDREDKSDKKDNDKKQDNKENKDSEVQKVITTKNVNDFTVADKKIPQTGENDNILLIIIGILSVNVLGCGIVLKKKNMI